MRMNHSTRVLRFLPGTWLKGNDMTITQLINRHGMPISIRSDLDKSHPILKVVEQVEIKVTGNHVYKCILPNEQSVLVDACMDDYELATG